MAFSSTALSAPSLPWDPPGPNSLHDDLPDSGTVVMFWSNEFVERFSYDRLEKISPFHVKHYELTRQKSRFQFQDTDPLMEKFIISRLYSNVPPWHDFVTNAGCGNNRCVTLLFNGTLPARMQIGTTIAWNVK